MREYGASPALQLAHTAPGSASMNIGEVLAHLRAEFPDTTISKLRFLEAEGLVEPSRTPSGYRKYTWADVSRLRYILTAQRDHYLPLRVIREQLDALDRGESPVGPPGRPALVGADPATGTGRTGASDGAELRLSRAELVERTGVSDELLTTLEGSGLVTARRGGWFDRDALLVVELVGQLAAYGVQVRHLRAYRGAADREVGLFRQVVAPLLAQRSPQARAKAADTIRELAALSVRLHDALVQAALRELS